MRINGSSISSTRIPHTEPVIKVAWGFVEAGQPLDHLVQLGLRAPLLLDLRHVVRVHRREAGGEDPAHPREPSAPGHQVTSRSGSPVSTKMRPCRRRQGRRAAHDLSVRATPIPERSRTRRCPPGAIRAATSRAAAPLSRGDSPGVGLSPSGILSSMGRAFPTSRAGGRMRHLHGSGATSTSGSTATYAITGADVVQVIDWAQRQAEDTRTRCGWSGWTATTTRRKILTWAAPSDGCWTAAAHPSPCRNGIGCRRTFLTLGRPRSRPDVPAGSRVSSARGRSGSRRSTQSRRLAHLRRSGSRRSGSTVSL